MSILARTLERIATFTDFFKVITDKQNTDSVCLLSRTEAIFGNGAAYDYPDRGVFNQERKIS